MKENELKYYSNLANWDFSNIKVKTERLVDWDFYKKIEENTNQHSLCLDLGTGGGEKVLKYYPNVGMIIGTDFSDEMVKTARENAQKAGKENVKYAVMDNLKMSFPNEIFDLVSARHTKINAKQIFNSLKVGGTLVIQGVDKKDCLDLKDLFGRGQAYKDEKSISDKDYEDLIDVGFLDVKKIEITENEYYETPEDLMALLLKTPILDDFSEFNFSDFEHKKIIEKDLFDEYVRRNKTEKGILLKRVLYGIVAKK